MSRAVDVGFKTIILALFIWLSFVVGVQLGIARGRNLAAREVPKNAPASAAEESTPALRCAQSPETGPVAWTQVDAEAAIRAAQQYLATAEHYQVPALKHAYAAQAEALLRLVTICWRPQ